MIILSRYKSPYTFINDVSTLYQWIKAREQERKRSKKSSHAKRPGRIGLHRLTRNGKARRDPGKAHYSLILNSRARTVSDAATETKRLSISSSIHPRLSFSTPVSIHRSPPSGHLLLYNCTASAFDKSTSTEIIPTTTHPEFLAVPPKPAFEEPQPFRPSSNTQHTRNEDLLLTARVRLLMGRSLDGELAQILPMERQEPTRNSSRHVGPTNRPQDWNCMYNNRYLSYSPWTQY